MKWIVAIARVYERADCDPTKFFGYTGCATVAFFEFDSLADAEDFHAWRTKNKLDGETVLPVEAREGL